MKTFSIQLWRSELVDEYKLKAKSEAEVNAKIDNGWFGKQDPTLALMLDKISWDGYELYIEEMEE